MNPRLLAIIGAAVVTAFVFGAFSVWIYEKGAAFDENVGPATLKGRAMDKKAHALEGLVSTVATGKLRRASRLLEGVEKSVLAIEGYLATDMYASTDTQFKAELAQLRSALDRGDWIAAKEATLAVEQSCMECHQLLLGH